MHIRVCVCIGGVDSVGEGVGDEALQDHCGKNGHIHSYTLTYTHTPTYLYIYVCICVFVYMGIYVNVGGGGIGCEEEGGDETPRGR